MEFEEIKVNDEDVNMIVKLDDDYKDDRVLLNEPDLEDTMEIDLNGETDE